MSYLILAAIIVYTGIWLWLWSGYRKIKSVDSVSEKTASAITFTVLIPVFNEEKNLPKLFESLERQNIDRENGQIIFALNRCTDRSEELVRHFCSEHSYASYYHYEDIPDGWSPKKYAIYETLKKIRSDIIIQTDADVMLPDNWIQSHLNAHSNHPDIHMIFGLYRFKTDESFFYKWLKTDRLWTFLISMVFAAKGHPMLGFGANFSYKNKAPEHMEILQQQKSVLSGDDDLLLQQLSSRGYKSGFIGDPSAWPETGLPSSWKQLWQQRKRHIKAGFYYSPLKQLFYALFIGSWSIILFSFLGTMWGLLLIVCKWVADYGLLKKYSALSGIHVNLSDVFIYEWLYVPYIWITGIASVLSGTEWE